MLGTITIMDTVMIMAIITGTTMATARTMSMTITTTPVPEDENNVRAVYLHRLADALTSVLAIASLLADSVYGWLWLDPLMGIVGALVIARWSWGLIRDAGAVLLDVIREAREGERDKITDLHVWQVGPGHHAANISLASPAPKAPSTYKDWLSHRHELSRVTVEVQPLPS